MAAVPVCYKIPISRDTWKRWHVTYPAADTSLKTTTRRRLNASKGAILNQGAFHFQNINDVSVLPRVYNMKDENFSMGSYASKSNTNEKQLRLLDSYFGKLQGNTNQPSLELSPEITKLVVKSREIDTMEELQSLNSYLDKLSKDANLKIYIPEKIPAEELLSVYEDTDRINEEKLKGFMKLRTKDPTGSRMYQALQQNNETSDLYIISVLISINIAVFLFELASPVRNSEFELFTLPLLYGAKINDLILVGEWWRLVTPMFLVQD